MCFYPCDLCLFAYNGVQHILCCVFLRLVYPMLPVSLDCPFLVAPLVFSNVYFIQMLSLTHTHLKTDMSGSALGCDESNMIMI